MDIIVPIKKFSKAKSRLASLLRPVERAHLAEILAATVLEQLSRVRRIRRVILASSEPSLDGIAARFGFELFADDPSAPGLNAAIGRAVRHACASGATDVGVVFSDLPLFKAGEFDEIVRLHLDGAPRQVTLVLDRFGTGTNVRLCRPGDLLPSLYGRNSAIEHQRAATACGAQISVVTSDCMSHDLDQPSDIGAVLDLHRRHALPPVLWSMFNKWVSHEARERQDICA